MEDIISKYICFARIVILINSINKSFPNDTKLLVVRVLLVEVGVTILLVNVKGDKFQYTNVNAISLLKYL